MTKTDYLGVLYLIKQPQECFQHRIRLQKLILIGKLKYRIPFSFSYGSYYYGPYSSDLTALVERCVKLNLIEELREDINGYTMYSYRLTQLGEKFLEKEKLNNSIAKKITKLWQDYRYLSNEPIINEAKRLLKKKDIK